MADLYPKKYTMDASKFAEGELFPAKFVEKMLIPYVCPGERPLIEIGLAVADALTNACPFTE